MSGETMSKLFLELSEVVPSGTKTRREIELERHVKALNRQLDDPACESRSTAESEVIRLKKRVAILEAFVERVGLEAVHPSEGRASYFDLLDMASDALSLVGREPKE